MGTILKCNYPLAWLKLQKTPLRMGCQLKVACKEPLKIWMVKLAKMMILEILIEGRRTSSFVKTHPSNSIGLHLQREVVQCMMIKLI
jgi:hypothetical protein